MFATIHIRAAYLAEWATAKWAQHDGIVHFPPWSDMLVLIADLMQRRPPYTSPIDSGNLRIALPGGKVADGVRKNPDTYNYISRRGTEFIEAKLRALFWAEAHEALLHARRKGESTLKAAAIHFITRYHIKSLTEDAILKSYRRWLQKMVKK